MSRIHDALRRGPAPAGMPTARRTAQADAILTALGYRSERPGIARRGLIVVALAVGAAAVIAWIVLPASMIAGRASRIETRDPGIEKSPAGPQSSIIVPRTPPLAATNVPAPIVQAGPPAPPASAGRVQKIDKQRPEPRSPLREPRIAAARPVALPTADEFQLALYYQRAGEFEQALLHYRAALQRDERNVEAHNNLGHLYLGKGLFDEAAREFQRVIAIDPGYVTAHVNLSAAYLSLLRFDAAAAEARAALQIDLRNPGAMVNLSLAQNAAGQAGEAQGSLRRALEIDPHNAAAHYNMARQFDAAGEASMAIDHYRQFIQYMGPEQAGFAADVRGRLAALAARIK